MTFVIGLTGSIGMGKSTTAQMFAEEGVPVWDADKAVRRLYLKDGAAMKVIAKKYPSAIVDEAVSRDELRALIAQKPEVLDDIQSIVHPMVSTDRAAFLSQTTAPIVVLDIPLLYEVGAETECDGVAVVSASAKAQKMRVLERGRMTENEFDMILSRQMPDADKRARARWVIPTLTLDGARKHVRSILEEILAEQAHA